MKFSKIIGKSKNPNTAKIISDAQDKLSSVIANLSLSYENSSFAGSDGIGGDPLIYQLVWPLPHYCDISAIQLDELEKELEDLDKDQENYDELEKTYRKQMKGRVLRTAATNGKCFFWAPQFVIQQSKIGLRFVVAHEAFHALYMHPSRRGSRMPKLWNIAVDFIVNATILEDLKIRAEQPKAQIGDCEKIFEKELGMFIPLQEYADFLKDPYNPPPRLAHFNPMEALKKLADPTYKEGEEEHPPMYFADSKLPNNMKRPEFIYEYLLSQIPKCPECGKLWKYKKPDEYKVLEKKLKSKKHNHNEIEKKCDCDDKCSSCGDDDYTDPFLGDTLDDHLDADVSENDLAKRMTDAIEAAKKTGGKAPGSIESELGLLTRPLISWSDFIRQQIVKKRKGVGRNDYSIPRMKPMSAGLYTPKQRDYFLNILFAYDTSGSMDGDDIAFAISQLQVIDDRGEINMVPWDSITYWDSMVKIKNAKKENLITAKRVGGGGTCCATVFNEYQEHCGKVDLIVIGTDGFLYDPEINAAKKPPKETDVLWLITSHNPEFKPPFGRVMHLKNEKL